MITRVNLDGATPANNDCLNFYCNDHETPAKTLTLKT